MLKPTPAVSSLLRLRCPTAIRRLVVAVVIDTIQGMLWRRLASHVSQEVLERCAPSLTDRDSAPSVVCPRSSFSIKAATLHVGPRPIFRRLPSVANLSVTQASFSSFAQLTKETATTSCRSASQVPRHNRSFFSAVAQADPAHVTMVPIGRARQHYKPPEALANQVKRPNLLNGGWISMLAPAEIMQGTERSSKVRAKATCDRALFFHITSIAYTKEEHDP